jgi:hypothetical protein
MWKLFVGIMVLLSSVFLAPFSSAQNPNLPENICAPVSDSEFDQESSISALDSQQDQNAQIDLLENGINPGFTSVPEIDKAQLMRSVAQFQAANSLPVTGSLDQQTLAKLNLPSVKSDSTSSAIERAKPSK